jgi:L-arabinokinase
MYRIIHHASYDLTDTTAFIETLNTLERHPSRDLRELFDRGSEITVARAPGRLDVMGGIADYSGSPVLEMPIREATYAALQRSGSRTLRIVSLSEDAQRDMFVEIPLEEFGGNSPLDYESARALFKRDPARGWAAYVAGLFLVLMRERDVVFHEGARILIDSRVPEGKGVSSSAALEVAVMQAVVAAYGIAIQPREMALLCQKVENLVVGAPCGVMDQMAAACSEKGRLLALVCQPAELGDSIEIPNEIAFWGLDSGVRHSISGADYGDVRAGAFMGYRMIAERAGLEIRRDRSTGIVQIEDPRWRGYLANMSPVEFERDYAARLPELMSGAAFLSRFHGTTDPVSRIGLEHNYAVHVATAHPIYENARVRRFAELISEGATRSSLTAEDAEVSQRGEQRLELMGELMYQSHASYSACGLGAAETDLLVRLVRESGPTQGLYGARITGGGSGGTVAVLGHRDAGDAIANVAERYAEETGHRPYVFSGSSPGSTAFGFLTLMDS